MQRYEEKNEKKKKNAKFFPFSHIYSYLCALKVTLLHNMKNVLLALALMLSTLAAKAQQVDSTAFHAYLYNADEDVYMSINFYDQDIVIKGQEIFGNVAGFLAKKGNSFCWIITSAEMEGNKAELEMVNDYGSDDLTATLTQVNDSTYTLQQKAGAALKVPVNSKWHKLPRTLTLKRRK